MADPVFWNAILGQSNANSTRWVPFGPGTLTVYQHGVDSSALDVNFGPWPYGWSSSDPNGWRAAAASAYAGVTHQVEKIGFLWWQGETDTNETTNSHYDDDLLELISNMDSRLGRSDAHWSVVRLNAAWDGGSARTLNLRARQEEAAAAAPSRITIIDVDDLPLTDGNHYAVASYQTAWWRHLLAQARHHQDQRWLP